MSLPRGITNCSQEILCGCQKFGRDRGIYLGHVREWLYWYDAAGNRLLNPEERVQQAETRAEQIQAQVDREQARAERLEDKLRALGIDPDSI